MEFSGLVTCTSFSGDIVVLCLINVLFIVIRFGTLVGMLAGVGSASLGARLCGGPSFGLSGTFQLHLLKLPELLN